ncbi:hypothetical protein HDV00_010909 [Rhizophlyctis rosea]|nr:hypothetical protein HDV00_010909 [Rhizophlyctis rosea]
MPSLCSAFFTSVDTFPHLEQLGVTLWSGWYSCDISNRRTIKSEEGEKEFRETGLKSLHKMPKLKVFSICEEDDRHAVNILDGQRLVDWSDSETESGNTEGGDPDDDGNLEFEEGGSDEDMEDGNFGG